MFTLKKVEFSNLTFMVQELEKKHLLRISLRIISDQLDNNFIVLPIATNRSTFTSNVSVVNEGSEEISHFSDQVKNHYPNFPIACVPIKPFENQSDFSLSFLYTPFRKDVFFVPTLESSFDNFDPDKDVYCNYSVSMSAKKDIWCKKRFTGWQQNADTLASVELIAAGMSDMIVRRPLWGLWHG